jgi:AP-3 complex subunit mu
MIGGSSSSSAVVMEEVTVVIPFAKYLRTANFKVTTGNVLFDEQTKVARWNIGK